MRIIGGRWRGRTLVAPAGCVTRPTAERLRQSLFDMLAHAPWSAGGAIAGARVLDAFAGTGALGLEALSRGAAAAFFFEADRSALAALRANIARCGAEASACVIGTDVTKPPPGQPCSLLFLDPPYGRALAETALAALAAAGWLAPEAVLACETSREETLAFPNATLLAERHTRVARLAIWRLHCREKG